MINLVCRKCGCRIPFLCRKNCVDTVNVDCFDLSCPECGHVMISIKNGVKRYRYRESRKKVVVVY